jgi:cobalt-zinc-cadmium efflux system outer membrane protein
VYPGALAFSHRKRLSSMKRWIRTSCPAQRAPSEKRGFLPGRAASAFATCGGGHIPVPAVLCWAVVAGIVAVVTAAGCVHYSPRPLPPEQLVASFADRRLDDPRLREFLDAHLPARSGQWPRPGWDRADLLLVMLYFNDAVAEGRAGFQLVAAARRTARERPNPNVTLLTEYANEENQLTEYANLHGLASLWLFGLTPDIPLDVGTKRTARIAVADLTAEQARYDFMEVVWKERVALRRALVDLLMTQREVSLLETVRTDREAQLEMARRRLEAGAASHGDLDRLVADAVADEQRLHDARRRVSAARSALASSMGVPVAAVESLSLRWEKLEEPQVDQSLLTRWREEALLARADVHSAVVGYSVAEEALRLEVAKQYPQVHVGPGYTWDHGIHRLQFNLSMEVPILNQHQGAIGEAEARREQAGARLEAAVETAYGEIDEAIRQWRLALERVADARGAVYEAAQRIYEDTERGFDAGNNDRTELVAARVARSLAELQILDAVRTAQEALAALEDAMRRPLEGPEIDAASTLVMRPDTDK